MVFLIQLFSLTITSCSDTDKDEPNNSIGDSSNNKLTFYKKANCPYASLPTFVALNNEIYMTNGIDFAKYQIDSNKWVELSTPKQISGNMRFLYLIVYCDDVYGVYSHYNSVITDFIKYNRNEDKWDSASNVISPLDKSNLTWVYVINNQIFAQCYWGDTYSYNSADKQWTRTTPYPSLPINPDLNNNCVIDNDLYYVEDCTLRVCNAESLKTSTKKVLDENYSMMTPFRNGNILLLNCNAKYEYKSYHFCLYNITENDYQAFNVTNTNSDGGLNNTIPITTDKLVYIKDKLFIGPSNGLFYELELK